MNTIFQRWWARLKVVAEEEGRSSKLACTAGVMAIIAVSPTGKASFVYSYVQTRLRGQYNENDPLASFMC